MLGFCSLLLSQAASATKYPNLNQCQVKCNVLAKECIDDGYASVEFLQGCWKARGNNERGKADCMYECNVNPGCTAEVAPIYKKCEVVRSDCWKTCPQEAKPEIILDSVGSPSFNH